MVASNTERDGHSCYVAKLFEVEHLQSHETPHEWSRIRDLKGSIIE
jgi:hypothetical protein